MRKPRNLFLAAALAIATTALTTSAASAAVEVKDGSGQSCSEVTCEVGFNNSYLGLEIQVGGGDYTRAACFVDFTATIDGSGGIDIPVVDAWHPASSFPCYPTGAYVNPALNDCTNSGFGGQIVGPGDESYTSLGDYEAIVTACFHYMNQGYGMGYEPIRFALDEVTSGIDWSFDEQPFGGPVGMFGQHDLDAYGTLDRGSDLQIEQVE